MRIFNKNIEFENLITDLEEDFTDLEDTINANNFEKTIDKYFLGFNSFLVELNNLNIKTSNSYSLDSMLKMF